MKIPAHKEKNKKNHFAGKSAQELLTKGEECLAKNRYKDAILIFKQLIKEENRADWKARLADAYLGRTKELAAKKMYKEALVVWENMEALCGEGKEPYLYVSLLINLGRYDEAMDAYIRFKDRITDKIKTNELDTIFASISLLNKVNFNKSIPAKDSPFLTQRDLALEAINYFCLGDDRQLEDIIVAIPFKSPYKGIRMFLKALTMLYSGKQDEAKKIIGKFGADTLLARFFEGFRLSVAPGRELMPILPNFGRQEKEIMASLIGITTDRINLACELMDKALLKNTRKLFKLLNSNIDIFGSDAVKKTCLGVLVESPSRIVSYQQIFEELNPFEAARIHALSAERQKKTKQAVEYWGTCVDELDHTGFTADEKKLATALILRRLADILSDEEYSPNSSRGVMVRTISKALGFLEESLDYDPYDKDTYVQIIQMSHVVHNQKVSQKWIDTAAKQFKNDVDIQLLAAKAAANRKSFKKAMKYADHVIEMDPINTAARNLLVNLLLLQARKQVKAKKFNLARKEFERAADLERDELTLSAIYVKHGFMEALANDNSACASLISKGRRLAGSPAIAAFMLSIESGRMKMSPEIIRTYNNEFAACKAGPAASKDAMTLIRMAESYALNEKGINAGDLVNQYLQKTLEISFSEPQLKTICEFLHKRNIFKTLSKYGRKGMDMFPKHPLFTYYDIFGKCSGLNFKLTNKHRNILGKAEEMAEAQNDTKTAKLIDDLLDDFAMPSHMPPNELRQIMDMIMGQGGEEMEEALDALDLPFEALDDIFSPKNRKPPRKKKPKNNTQQRSLF